MQALQGHCLLDLPDSGCNSKVTKSDRCYLGVSGDGDGTEVTKNNKRVSHVFYILHTSLFFTTPGAGLLHLFVRKVANKIQ
jgi:hypothetical protein